MTLIRTLTITLLVGLMAGRIYAQESRVAGLTVRSNPAGALVELKGDATVTGITPTSFVYPFTGEFEIKVSKFGYENYRSRILLTPDKETTMDVSLKRKTKFKAAVRSMFFPGWGQKYADQKGKSLFFVVLTGTAVASYFIADHNFDIKFDRYDRMLTQYDDALADGAPYSELSSRLDDLERAQDEAYDAETVRRVAIGAIAVSWGLSVLDALLFTPEETAGITIKGITMESKSENMTFGLALTRNF